MSLRLNVPALEDNPAIPAEVRPKAVQELISSLPQGNPRATARLLLEELERLNRQKFSADTRLTALELYRPAILNTVHALSRQYCHQPLPLQETAKAQADLTLALFDELAIGYKQAILSEEDRLFTLGDNNQLAMLLQRAMDALGRLLRVHHLTYSHPAPGVWSELHLLYLHALQLSIQNLGVPDDQSESSINIVYKHALLLALASPAHLNSIDIERTIQYLDHFANLSQLHPLMNPEKPAGVFLVELKSDLPPTPLVKNAKDADPRTDILLITIELARQAHQHISSLQAGASAAIPGLPDEARLDQRYRDLLQHLLKHWGNPPKRGFQRSQKTAVIEMCVGIAAIHHFLKLEASQSDNAARNQATDVMLNFATSPIDSGGGSIFKAARWMVTNESPGGFSLKKPLPAQESLRIGELLGLKPDHAHRWGLAIVRWASSDEGSPLQVGAQMIAPGAEAVTLHFKEDLPTQSGLLLPEITALKQPATLVAARGLYKPARTLQLEENGELTDIMLTRLVERTHNVERFQFSRL